MVAFHASHGVLDAAGEPAMDSEYTLGQHSALETLAGSALRRHPIIAKSTLRPKSVLPIPIVPSTTTTLFE